MAKAFQEISLSKLTETVRDARQKKGWTLEELSHELRQLGLPTSNNKLWRLENKPPKRIDTELLLFLEKALDVELIESGEKSQVLIEDVLELLDNFVDAVDAERAPEAPGNHSLRPIFDRLVAINGRPGRRR